MTTLEISPEDLVNGKHGDFIEFWGGKQSQWFRQECDRVKRGICRCDKCHVQIEKREEGRFICESCKEHPVCRRDWCKNKCASYVVLYPSRISRIFLFLGIEDFCEEHSPYSEYQNGDVLRGEYGSKKYFFDRTQTDFSKKGKIGPLLKFKRGELLRSETRVIIRCSSYQQAKILKDKYPESYLLSAKYRSQWCGETNCRTNNARPSNTIILFTSVEGDLKYGFQKGTACNVCYERMDATFKLPTEWQNKWKENFQNIRDVTEKSALGMAKDHIRESWSYSELWMKLKSEEERDEFLASVKDFQYNVDNFMTFKTKKEREEFIKRRNKRLEDY